MFYFLTYNANILHHNISRGNIIILEEEGGFLIDCDMCVHVEEETEPSGRAERTVRICFFLNIVLLLIFVFIGNMAIHVSISSLE